MTRYLELFVGAACIVVTSASNCIAGKTVDLSNGIKVVFSDDPGERIALKPDILHVRNAKGETIRVRVVLRRRQHEYQVTARWGAEPTARTMRRPLYQYELRSVSGSPPYSWSYCGDRPLTGFRLFSRGSGQNYLAWINAPRVYLAEVARGVDAITAVKRMLGQESGTNGIEHVPVEDLAGSRPFLSHNGIDIRIQSVHKDKKGRLTLEVKGSQSGDKVFKFVREKADPAQMSKLPKWQRSEWSWRLVE